MTITVLIAAIKAGSVDEVRSIISRESVDVNANMFADKPLGVALRTGDAGADLQKNRYEIIKILLEVGADINGACPYHDSALLRAVTIGDIRIIQLLLKQRPNVNIQSPPGEKTPLFYGNSDTRIMKLLLANGADPTLLSRKSIIKHPDKKEMPIDYQCYLLDLELGDLRTLMTEVLPIQSRISNVLLLAYHTLAELFKKTAAEGGAAATEDQSENPTMQRTKLKAKLDHLCYTHANKFTLSQKSLLQWIIAEHFGYPEGTTADDLIANILLDDVEAITFQDELLSPVPSEDLLDQITRLLKTTCSFQSPANRSLQQLRVAVAAAARLHTRGLVSQAIELMKDRLENHPGNPPSQTEAEAWDKLEADTIFNPSDPGNLQKIDKLKGAITALVEKTQEAIAAADEGSAAAAKQAAPPPTASGADGGTAANHNAGFLEGLPEEWRNDPFAGLHKRSSAASGGEAAAAPPPRDASAAGRGGAADVPEKYVYSPFVRSPLGWIEAKLFR
jgi:hypothetical protein